MRKTLSIISVLVLLACPAAFASSRIAIIIDDMGNKASDLKALSLPGNVTFSILPHTPFAKQVAAKAALQGRDVMLHIPMESLARAPLGPGAITSNMTNPLIYQTLEQAYAEIPSAIGINNHMGSKLTQLSRPMQSIMQFLSDNNLLFLDSRTTRYSRAQLVAKQYGVESLHRHVFLDHYPREKQIEQQFRRLLAKAKKNGFAIGIAHPYPATVRVLQKQLANMPKQQIELVSTSALTLEAGEYAYIPKDQQQLD